MGDKWDVAVAGAGPAGLMAALRAAKDGASVVVVDRKKVVGEPVQCGEGTFTSVLETFDMDDGPWINSRPSVVRVHSPKGRAVTIRFRSLQMLVLDRTLWEQEMARRAREAGAEILLERGVKDVTQEDGSVSMTLHNGDTISAGLLIGADGVESLVGRKTGLTRPLPPVNIGTAAQYKLRGSLGGEDTVEVFLGERVAPGGYAWKFPKGNGVYNVGAGTIGTERGRHAIDLLKNFVSEHYPDAEVLNTMAGCVPVGPPIDTAVKGRVMLAGDAARHSYPVGGGGIHSALLAGAIAGDAAALYTKDGRREHLQTYDDEWRKLIYKSLSKSYKRRLWLYKSEARMERFVTLGRILSPFLRALPIDILKFWWGNYTKYGDKKA